MRYFVIGDVHGRFKRLVDVLKQIESFKTSDNQIVFLGDYVSRGPESRKVLTLVKELVDSGQAVAIKGNHDDMMVKCYRDPVSEESFWWKHNYLKKTNQSYHSLKGWDSELYKEHVMFIESMPLWYTTETFYFSHSGDPKDPLWGRPPDQDLSVGVYPLYNIHGHTPRPSPFIGKYRANLDTGAAWENGRLTCGIWDEGSKQLVELIQSIDRKN